MKSRIIGRIELDEAALAQELEIIKTLPFNKSYSEYAIGDWRNCVLWNQSGNHEDTIFNDYEGLPQPTALGKQTRYLSSVIESTFNLEYLRWARIFLVKSGMLRPHRDYLEFEDQDFSRCHIPIQTDESSMHTENENVFNMRKGEIWYLDASVPHSACSFSGIERMTINLDFFSGVPFEKLFKNDSYVADGQPKMVERPAMTDEYLESLMDLSTLIHPYNFDEIVGILSKVHYLRVANPADTYDWLIEICKRANQGELHQKAIEMKKYFLGE
ncbi:MAG: aspartyl/asparaginyl beta-hydroxylase domain-containing protein [Phototrophicaceae bacterium]